MMQLINEYEYISQTKVFGIPLIHIKGHGTAKGIVAIGPLALGIISIGILPTGLISLGALSTGILLAVGGLSFSLFTAIGGVALSFYLSIGGVGISYFYSLGGAAIANHCAIGGAAVAKLAVGASTKGTLAIFSQNGYGQTVIDYTKVSSEYILQSIKEMYPNISGWFIELVKLTIR